MSAPMTPERLAEIRRAAERWRFGNFSPEIEELVAALETERARLDTLATLRPGELFDALSDPRGLRVALDERIAEREKGVGR